VSDLCCCGDVAMGKTDPRGASDCVLVLTVRFALASCCSLDAPQDIAAQLAPSTCLSDAFGVCDRCEWHARRDCGARRVGHSGARGLFTFSAFIHQNA